MEFISNCTAAAISKAAKALKDGHLVAFPTETVYGLGADATNKNSVSQVYVVKGRPTDHPLIVHISSINQISKWATDIPDYAIKLARDFWPGPMTLILKRSDLAKDFITGGQDNVGLRVPNQPLALALLAEFDSLGGQGVAAPSANRFGAVSPTTSLAVSEELEKYLGSNDLILDGGSCHIGIESTIINCTGVIPTILRPGAIANEMVENSIGSKIDLNTPDSDIKASGLLDKHYSPKARVRLNMLAEPGEGFIAMASISTPAGAIRLASPRNNQEFARALYEALRDGDRFNLDEIKVILPEGGELVEAINDRMIKSSFRMEHY
jgi:L-threonylcarbamoyladenylate synthase